MISGQGARSSDHNKQILGSEPMMKALLVAAFLGLLAMPVANANAADEATTEAAPATEGDAAATTTEEGAATEEHKDDMSGEEKKGE